MLKKTLPFILAFVAALPVQNAGAWDQVCLKLPAGRAWFTANLHVISSFDDRSGKLPSRVVRGPNDEVKLNSRLGEMDENLVAQKWHYPAAGSASVAETRCADISELEVGTPFFVYVDPNGVFVYRPVLCDTHPSNPNKWYHQQDRPYSTLWYESWGHFWSPGCKFTHESK